MGLYISTMRELPTGDRSLYLYLLDYGWPNGPYEQLFRNNFGHLAARSSETGAVVIMSGRGVHFANEVLDWHQVYGHDASDILPALLVTQTHPSYFVGHDAGQFAEHPRGDDGLGDLALIPLRSACTEPSEFLALIGSIFDDLERGLTLRSFRADPLDLLTEEKPSRMKKITGRVGRAFLLQPNISGIGVDLKVLFGDPK
jgi:hypothetical protein